ncbi:hypothetical protein WSM22_13470 [Cytophagales bacterium WSM2-2]|nr:hypothetical protein WSM22_13470 [Cytophagales bacterium WSM2-2]
MKGDSLIKVGFCVAYDWQLLKTSLPLVYGSADVICLAVDKDRHAWSGQPYAFDNDAFYRFVSQIDVDKKILLYEDDFSLPELNKRENCNRHRTLIAQKMGEGGWHIQVDADEYFIDFEGFCKYLRKFNRNPRPSQKAINICCAFVPLIKKVNEGYLYVDFKHTLPELIPMATNRPDYQRARQNGHFNHIAPFHVIHETWARSEEELWFKINHWGHASEELEEKGKRESYFNLWKALDRNNFQYINDFHPASPKTWPALGFAAGHEAKEFVESISLEKFPLSPFQRAMRNNRNIARLKALLR